MADLFKGYLPSKGKAPLQSVKKGIWLSEPPENHDYVGILRDDMVQIDFDDEDVCDIVLKIVDRYKLKCDILKTKRGIHLYFLNDGHVKKSDSGLWTAMGLPCDAGVGSKNRTCPLRVTDLIETKKVINGEEVKYTSYEVQNREWIQTYDTLDVIPPYFRPIGKTNYYLENCSTRNQTLFNYILVLQKQRFTREEIRKTMKLINEYVFKEKLSDRELDTITRDEAFSEALFFDADGKFLHNVFSDYMLSNSNILKIRDDVYIYNIKNTYSNMQQDFERIMINKIPTLKKTQRNEVYEYLKIMCDNVGEFSHPRYLGLKNSVLDIETMEEHPYSPRWVLQNKINYVYNPNAYCEDTDRILDKVTKGDKQIRALLEEMIGYTLFRKNSMQVCFILTGEGKNGKSTIMNTIKHLLGEDNYTSLDMSELEDQFKPSELHGKLANIGDDISSKYLEGTSVFKKVVTGETFMAMRKFGHPFKLESYATQIFSANELPQVRDKSDGFNRRIVLVPFNATFSPTDVDYDPFIEDKLKSDSSIEYLLKLGIAGLKRLMTTRQFTKSDLSESDKDDYIKSNNNVLEWFETEPHIENEGVNDIYLAYQVWCVNNGCHAVKKLNFSKEIKKTFNFVSQVKSINGKATRIYVKGE